MKIAVEIAYSSSLLKNPTISCTSMNICIRKMRMISNSQNLWKIVYKRISADENLTGYNFCPCISRRQVTPNSDGQLFEVDAFTSVYKKLTGRDVTFEFPENYL